MSRSVRLTGLSSDDPTPGHFSEVDFTPGAGGASGAAPSSAYFSVYSDVSESITSVDVNGTSIVSGWGALTQASSGSRPLLITDSVTGQQAVRFDTGKTMSLAAGAADFLHQSASVVLIVWRSRNFTPGSDYHLLDSSSNGASKGYQVHIKEASGQYREIFGRISTGAGFSLDQPSVAVRNAYNAMQWNVTAITVTATTFDEQSCGVSALGYPPPIGISTPFQTGAGGALTVGNSTVDIAAIEAWTPAALGSVSAAMARLSARFSTRPSITLWADGVRYYGFASPIKCANGDILVVCRNGVEHSGDVGWLETRRRPFGSSVWGAAVVVQIDASLDSRDPCLSLMSNGDLLLSYFLQNFIPMAPTPTGTSWVRRSTDNGLTWGSPVQGTAGFTSFENCSARLLDVGSGVVYWPIYGANISDGNFSSGALLKSTDGGHTFPTHTTPCNGVTDSKEYAEPGLLKLADTTYLLTVRQDTDLTMEERTSANAVTWSGPTAYPTIGGSNMASRLMQLASGRVIEMLRPGQYGGAPTTFSRISPGVWTNPPVAPQIDATPSPTDYGDYIEISPGVVGVAYGIQYLLHGPSDVRYREFNEWELAGQMPGAISPASVTLDVSTTQQFTATGAGNVVWTISPNNTGGSINSSTGLYTAGTNGSATDTIIATDPNGFAITVAHATTNAVAIETPDVTYGAALKQWLRGDLGSISSWTDKSGNANHATQASAPVQPSILTANLNGKNVYRFASGAYMAHALNLTAPAMVFVVMAARDASTFGEAYTAGAGIPAVEASQDGSNHWGIYTSGGHSSGVSIQNVFKICCIVFRSNTDCDLITDGSVVNVNPGAPFFATSNNVGVDHGGLGDAIAVDIAEIVAVQGSVTTPQLNKTVTYLQNRYGAI